MASTLLADNGVSSGSAGLKSSADSSGVLALQTTTAGGTATTAVTVDTSQNVGVGVTPNTWSLGKAVEIGVTGAGFLGYGNQLTASKNAYYNAGWKYARTGDNALQFDMNGGQFAWYNSASGTAGNAITFTQAMTLDASGNLLVGTTSSSLGSPRLVVQNSGASANGAHFYFTSTDDRGNVLIQHAGATGATSRKQISFFNASSSEVGYVSSTGSATTYSTSSDYRLKENIAPMTGALDKVVALKPVTYTWKVDGVASQGFIAHELAEVVPDCVTGEKDAVDAEGNPVYQGIDTSFLVATLTAAIQEQNQLITDLTNRITALEGTQA